MPSNFYLAYLEQKIEFLEKQVQSIINRYNKGGTLIMFPDYEDWGLFMAEIQQKWNVKGSETKPTTPLSERNHPML